MKYSVTGEQGVAVLVGVALTHELLAQENQLLSHAFDRWLEKHPWLVRVAVVVTALHLLNLLPNEIDPFARVGNLKESNA